PHQPHHEHAEEQRPLHQELVAEAIADAAPQRRARRRHGGRDAEREAGPQRHRPRLVYAELLKAQREEGHHQREAGEPHERRDHQRRLVAAPVVHGRPRSLKPEARSRQKRILTPRSAFSARWMLSTKRIGCVCITSDTVRVPSPKKRTPFMSVPSVTPVAANTMFLPGARSFDL